MSDFDDVCVLLPAYEEAETVGTVVSSFREAGLPNVLVVDGGSTDGTREIASEAGARVVEQSGEGKGQAIREGVREHVEAPYVLMADADATYDAGDAHAMLEPLLAGEAEHVVGNRFADMRPGAMTRLNRVGNRLINGAFRAIHGEDYGDILSGYRAFTRESFGRLTLTADGFGVETEMAVECVKQRVSVAVVPVTYRPRPDGSSTNLHPVRDGGVIFLELYRKAKTNNPLFYFGSVGTVSTLAGALMAAFVLYRWIVFDVGHEIIAVAATGAIILGMQLVVFGVLADMILSLHREQLDRQDRVVAERLGSSAGNRGGDRDGGRSATGSGACQSGDDDRPDDSRLGEDRPDDLTTESTRS
ncbi:TIGR04182 family glycosyltransferase [Halorubrum sp. 48-1-W]|uniref:S-layer glycoprotein N-glycosyltransferase AglJ n=1 Tax=Halorubrum sp. 48-1-W TaxID=2249761 RepID=UPI000DCD1BF2|nr:S-layer glycoprotein N-glycosyltransferase AglJ [Halorubrum sp. 48-1-W]RAW45537.1 TIGR04182 family glycosyltransferase [Halorubrum sp. 48-1-W]